MKLNKIESETSIITMLKMQKGRVIALILLLTTLTLVNFTIGINLIDSDIVSDKNEVREFENEDLKYSDISSKIHIRNNWTAAKLAGFCTGSGTFNDPYVIEDLIIDGQNSSSCILIENSKVYFRIENCTVYYSRSEPWEIDAGIELRNVSNSLLINNLLYDNHIGIFLANCNNNTVSENTVNNNTWNGIELSGSHFNSISGNIVNNNGNINIGTPSNQIGILIEFCHNNTISGNIANNNGKEGIKIWRSVNNTISKNNASSNMQGIRLDEGNNNKVSGNTADNNRGGGISLWECNSTMISKNNASNNLQGIYLNDSNMTTISKNLMKECGLYIWGTFEEFDPLYIDTTNLVNGKPLYYYANEVNLRSNNFSNAGQVILVKCNDSVISNVDLSHGSVGIMLIQCENNTVSSIKANNNALFGIGLRNSNNNVISGNTANYNAWFGIELRESNNNMISGNIFKYNEIQAISEIDSIGNVFENNVLKDDNSLIIIIVVVIGIILLILGSVIVYLKKVKKTDQGELKPSEEEEKEVIPSTSIELNAQEISQDEIVPIENEISTVIELPPEHEVKTKFNIFISYSTLDSKYLQIRKLIKNLEKFPEIEKAYFWEVDSKENIVEFMDETLKKTNIFVLFCTENSMSSNSVKNEWQAAFQRSTKGLMKIIPVYEDEDLIPPLLGHFLNVKFTKDDFKGFIEELYREILR